MGTQEQLTQLREDASAVRGGEAAEIRPSQKFEDKRFEGPGSSSSPETPSLSSASSRARQSAFSATLSFVCFNVLRRRATLARARASSSSATDRSDSSLLRVRSRDSHDTPTHGRPRRTHSAHLGWFSIFTQRIERLEQWRQAVDTGSPSLLMD